MEDDFFAQLGKIDETPEGTKYLPSVSLMPTNPATAGMSVRQKLEFLNEKLIDTCIDNLSSGKIKPNDLGAVVTLLKNNKVVEEKREESESDIIDALIVEK